VPRETSRRPLPGLTKSTGYIAHPFDLAHGVRTSGLVAGRHLKTEHVHSQHATACYAVAPSVFHEIVRRWRRTRPVAAIGDTTFIDVGAGMGRAVLLASELGFQRVLGVELHPALVRIAKRNLVRWRRDGQAMCPARVVEADALELEWPAGPTVLFLFNPFGAVAMRRLLPALARAFAGRTGELDILYVNNEQEAAIQAKGGFVRLWSGPIFRSRADAAADRRILLSQPEAEYAAPAHEDCSIWRWQGTRKQGIGDRNKEKGLVWL
jgi:predicted RNA methylase